MSGTVAGAGYVIGSASLSAWLDGLVQVADHCYFVSRGLFVPAEFVFGPCRSAIYPGADRWPDSGGCHTADRGGGASL